MDDASRVLVSDFICSLYLKLSCWEILLQGVARTWGIFPLMVEAHWDGVLAADGLVLTGKHASVDLVAFGDTIGVIALEHPLCPQYPSQRFGACAVHEVCIVQPNKLRT